MNRHHFWAAGSAGLMAVLVILLVGAGSAQEAPNPILDVVTQDIDRLLQRAEAVGLNADIAQSLATDFRVAALSFDDAELQHQVEEAVAATGGVRNLAADIMTSGQEQGLEPLPVPLLSMNSVADAIEGLRDGGLSALTSEAIDALAEEMGVSAPTMAAAGGGLVSGDGGVDGGCDAAQQRRCNRAMRIAADLAMAASVTCRVYPPGCAAAIALAASFYATARWLCRNCD